MDKKEEEKTMNKKILIFIFIGMFVLAGTFITAKEIKEINQLEKFKEKTDKDIKDEVQNSFNQTHCKTDSDDKRHYCYSDLFVYEKIGDELINKTISIRAVIPFEEEDKCLSLHSEEDCKSYLEGYGFNYTEQIDLGNNETESRTIHFKGLKEQFESLAQTKYEKSKKIKSENERSLNLDKVQSIKLNE